MKNTKNNVSLSHFATSSQQSIIASCNVKIFMKLEDPQTTYDLFVRNTRRYNLFLRVYNAIFK